MGALLLALGSQDAAGPEGPRRYPWPFAPTDRPGRVLSAYHNPLRADSPSAYFHGGVDIHAEPGSEVRAVASGRVEVYSDHRYENVVLTEAGGEVWEYRHLVAGSVPGEVRRRAERREPVQVGDVLGRSPRWGDTGYDHIHLNRRGADGAVLDPLDHLLPIEDALPPVVGEILVLPDGGRAAYEPGPDGVVEVGGEVDVAVLAMDRCRPDDFHQAPVAIEWSVGELPERRFAPCAGRLPQPARLPVPRYPMAGVGDAYLLSGPLRSRNPTYTPVGQRFVSVVTHAGADGALDPQGRFDTRALEDGEYPLRVVAVDHAGNRGERTIVVRVRNDPAPEPPAAEPTPIPSPAADDYRIAQAGTSIRHTFRVRNHSGREVELTRVAPVGRSGRVLSWTRRTPHGGTLEVEVETPAADWPGERRTLVFSAETPRGRVALHLRLESTRR